MWHSDYRQNVVIVGAGRTNRSAKFATSSACNCHHSLQLGNSQSDVQYVAVVVGCELAVEDGSFVIVRLLRVEEGDCTVRDSGYDKCY